MPSWSRGGRALRREELRDQSPRRGEELGPRAQQKEMRSVGARSRAVSRFCSAAQGKPLKGSQCLWLLCWRDQRGPKGTSEGASTGGEDSGQDRDGGGHTDSRAGSLGKNRMWEGKSNKGVVGCPPRWGGWGLSQGVGVGGDKGWILGIWV